MLSFFKSAPVWQMEVILVFSIRSMSYSGSANVRNSGQMDVNSFLSPPCEPGFKKITSESQMCAIRLNWMADLAYDQAGAGKTKGTPVSGVPPSGFCPSSSMTNPL